MYLPKPTDLMKRCAAHYVVGCRILRGRKTMTVYRILLCATFGSLNFLHITATLAQPSFNEQTDPVR
jgi:hypothetical protein